MNEWWMEILRRIRENDPDITELKECGYQNFIQEMTDEEWEQLGRDIANNTHLEEVDFITRHSMMIEWHAYSKD